MQGGRGEALMPSRAVTVPVAGLQRQEEASWLSNSRREERGFEKSSGSCLKRAGSMNLWLLGEGIVREAGMGMYTLLPSGWMTNKDLPSSSGHSAQCCVAA